MYSIFMYICTYIYIEREDERFVQSDRSKRTDVYVYI